MECGPVSDNCSLSSAVIGYHNGSGSSSSNSNNSSS